MTYTGGQRDDKEQLESIDTDKPIYLFIQKPNINYIDKNISYLIDRYDRQNDILYTYEVTEDEYKSEYIDFYRKLSITKEFGYIGKYVIFSREYSVYKLA